MGNFTKNINKEYEFDDDTIKVTMNRMKRKDAIKISPHMTYDENGELKMSFENQMLFMDVGAGILERNINSIDGLVVDGRSLNTEDAKALIFNETYFMSLLSEMMGDLVQASFIGDDEGKSEEPSESFTAASAISTGEQSAE